MTCHLQYFGSFFFEEAGILVGYQVYKNTKNGLNMILLLFYFSLVTKEITCIMQCSC